MRSPPHRNYGVTLDANTLNDPQWLPAPGATDIYRANHVPQGLIVLCGPQSPFRAFLIVDIFPNGELIYLMRTGQATPEVLDPCEITALGLFEHRPHARQAVELAATLRALGGYAPQSTLEQW